MRIATAAVFGAWIGLWMGLAVIITGCVGGFGYYAVTQEEATK